MPRLFHSLCLFALLPFSLSAGEETVLSDITGKKTTPLNCSNHKASLLIFITTDCPIANSYAPEIKRIINDYRRHDVKVTLVHVDPGLSNADAAKHAADYGLNAADAIVVDRNHHLVKYAKATLTPEAAVFTPDRKLAYLGRINDQYAGYGDRRTKATTEDLRNALDAILAGKPVPTSRTEAIGCYIPDLD
jgi:hypothetical protein